MTVQHVGDLKTPIGDLLTAVGPEGILLEAKEGKRYALMPLDEDLLDYLLERSPKLMGECQRIRERMQAGHFHTHEEVKRLLGGDGKTDPR